jgi:hypothetical protein
MAQLRDLHSDFAHRWASLRVRTQNTGRRLVGSLARDTVLTTARSGCVNVTLCLGLINSERVAQYVVLVHVVMFH